MKRIKRFTLFGLLLLAGILYFVFKARVLIDLTAAEHDPASLRLSPRPPAFLRSTLLPNRIQTGLVTLQNGETVKFWFYYPKDSTLRWARFDFEDGTRHYIGGNVFCCEVILDPSAAQSKEALIESLSKSQASTHL